MSEETKAFIDKLADGDNAGAGEAFKDALRVKVGSQLDQARNCLLYTSPSPRDGLLSRMPSSA